MKTLNLLLFTLLLVMQTGNASAGGWGKKKPVSSPNTAVSMDSFKQLLEKSNQLSDSVEILLIKVNTLEDTNIKLLKESEIDCFLNIQDTTIFGSRFVVTSIDKVAFRSKKFYSLIQDIHNLNLLLVEVENMKVGQFSTAGAQLINVGGLIDKINSYASIENGKITDFLSEEQKQYYRDLVERYNKLVVQINFN